METCIKISFVISSMRAGGAERVLSLLANALSSKGYEVTIFSFDRETEVPFYSLNKSIKWLPLNLLRESRSSFEGMKNNIKRITALRRSILREQPEVVVSFMDMTNIVTIIALSGSKIPILICDHTDPRYAQLTGTWKFLRRIFYPRAKKLIVLTKEFADFYQFMPKEQMVIIPNPIEGSSGFSWDIREKNNNKRVISVGRLVASKRHDLLIRAFAQLAEKYPNWTLIILGEGEVRSVLQELINSLQLTDRIQLAGLIENPYDDLVESHLFVLSSSYEGFPMALAEAMSVGLPVITTDCSSGVRELLDEGRAGILVPVGQIEPLVRAMEAMFVDEKMRITYGQLAYQRIQLFHIDKILWLWEKLLDEVINRKRVL